MRTAELRAFRPTVLVAALAAVFGSVVVIAVGVVTTGLHAAGFDQIASVGRVLSVVGWAFLALAVFVGAIVTANTCATVIAGRSRALALQRLIGATAGSLRATVVRTGLVVGLVGALFGTAVGIALSAAAIAVLRGNGFLPAAPYDLVPVGLVLPVLAVVGTTWGAFVVGSRPVLRVRPLEAVSAVVEQRHEDVRAHRGRRTLAIVLMAVGTVGMLLGVLVSPLTPLAVLPALLGGFLSFTGITVGAPVVMPPVLAAIGRIGQHDPVVLLAGRNALRAPGRSSRATIGLVIGVALLVTFAVALGILRRVVTASLTSASGARAGAAELAAIQTRLAQMGDVVTALVAFSAVIAAVGVVNALALSVLQRRRELGLLRVLGLTAGQVRRMVVTEAVQMVTAAVVTGVALGLLYGWVAAQTLLGTLHVATTPVLPTATVVEVVVGSVVLTVVATVAPVRSALRVTPTQALAVD